MAIKRSKSRQKNLSGKVDTRVRDSLAFPTQEEEMEEQKESRKKTNRKYYLKQQMLELDEQFATKTARNKDLEKKISTLEKQIADMEDQVRSMEEEEKEQFNTKTYSRYSDAIRLTCIRLCLENGVSQNKVSNVIKTEVETLTPNTMDKMPCRKTIANFIHKASSISNLLNFEILTEGINIKDNRGYHIHADGTNKGAREWYGYQAQKWICSTCHEGASSWRYSVGSRWPFVGN